MSLWFSVCPTHPVSITRDGVVPSQEILAAGPYPRTIYFSFSLAFLMSSGEGISMVQMGNEMVL
jgi:hypothetical protein